MISRPDQILMTVECEIPPTLENIAAKLGIAPGDMDSAFGVVPVDPEHNLYAVRIAADSAPAQRASADRFLGPFSDPKIAPAGPVRRSKP